MNDYEKEMDQNYSIWVCIEEIKKSRNNNLTDWKSSEVKIGQL